MGIGLVEENLITIDLVKVDQEILKKMILKEKVNLIDGKILIKREQSQSFLLLLIIILKKILVMLKTKMPESLQVVEENRKIIIRV